MINLYDWLQAFLSIVDPEDVDNESKRTVNPELQYPYWFCCDSYCSVFLHFFIVSSLLIITRALFILFLNKLNRARFTQAVAELEYLGFIKSSKRKADHVTRLTWGG